MQKLKNSFNYVRDKFGTPWWSPSKNIPDLTGRVAIVTGGSSGIGYETVKQLAAHHAYVIMASCNADRCMEAIQRIRTGDDDDGVGVGVKTGTIEYMHLDLASLKSIEQFAEAFHSKNLPLNILINNAGVGIPEGPERTEDDIEVHMGVLFFGHFYLTHLLLDIIRRSSPSRIVFMGFAEEFRGVVPWDDLLGEKLKKKEEEKAREEEKEREEEGTIIAAGGEPGSGKTSYNWYGSAHLCKVMIAREMSNRLRSSAVLSANPDVFAVQPGMTSTDFFRKQDYSKPGPTLHNKMQQVGVQKPEVGALSVLYAATEPSLEGSPFKYIGPWYYWLPTWGVTATRKFPMALNVFQTASLEPTSREGRNLEACRRLYKEAANVLEKKLGKSLPHRLE